MERILLETDPISYKVHGKGSQSPFILVSDHAGIAVPQKFGDMGVSASDWTRHIALDIGIRGVAEKLQKMLQCYWVEQIYSRLVIDCNRRIEHPGAIPEVSDGTEIPFNKDLSIEEKLKRQEEIYTPYHKAISKIIDEYKSHKRDILFVSLHSFTPIINGKKRPWDIGFLHDHDDKTSQMMAALLKKHYPHLTIGDNQPYELTRYNDYTVPHHGEENALDSLEIEIRQDHLLEEEGQLLWAKILYKILLELGHKKHLFP